MLGKDALNQWCSNCIPESLVRIHQDPFKESEFKTIFYANIPSCIVLSHKRVVEFSRGYKTVEFWGKKWKTFGLVSETIEELTPLSWNKKVMVERYEH